MRINVPVTQQNFDFPGDELLVSTTNTKGEITHCNPAFARVSGYAYDELIGQPHNLIRHPDMPAAAFKDMWGTIGRGRPWTGLVKNRRKNGDHYWVRANVTPIMEGGKPRGYLSVRTKPVAREIDEAEALYARMRAEAESGRATLALRGGELYPLGWRGALGVFTHLGLTARMALVLLLLSLCVLLPDALGATGAPAVLARAAVLAGGAGMVVWWFERHFVGAIDEAGRFAADVAGCNLATDVRSDYPEALGMLLRRLQQIQINLRAVVGDVRTGVHGFSRTASEIAQGSADLAARTESQAASLEETAASMEELAGTVAHTADTAQRMAQESVQSTQVAGRGAAAIQEVGTAMEQIHRSSTRMGEIIGVIESIAFQTNILALNAAVEAARAGEQGRGFAVVAAEVRALAQRSAAAAKEISGLIHQTVAGIGDGNHRMEQAGHTISGMVASVECVSALVRQISNATHEQSLGLAQVNEAVAQLDTVTQQNAALVEESAAAAKSLRASAHGLERSVDVFTLR